MKGFRSFTSLKREKVNNTSFFAVVQIGFRLTPPSAIMAIPVTSLYSLLVFVLSVWQGDWG
jgi:hypothetical protein